MAGAAQGSRHARALCVELAGVTRGRVMQWRTVEPIAAGAGLDDAAASQAIAFAVERDWLLAEGSPPHSVCLTDGGRVMAAKMKRR
jgi:hypothetical protein